MHGLCEPSVVMGPSETRILMKSSHRVERTNEILLSVLRPGTVFQFVRLPTATTVSLTI